MKELEGGKAKEWRAFITRHKKEIHIGLLEEHYFLIKKIPITSYAINNYNEIKHLKDFIL